MQGMSDASIFGLWVMGGGGGGVENPSFVNTFRYTVIKFDFYEHTDASVGQYQGGFGSFYRIHSCCFARRRQAVFNSHLSPFCETGKQVSFFLAIFLRGDDNNKRSDLKIFRVDTKRGSNALVSTAVTVPSAPEEEFWSSLICGCAPQD